MGKAGKRETGRGESGNQELRDSAKADQSAVIEVTERNLRARSLGQGRFRGFRVFRGPLRRLRDWEIFRVSPSCSPRGENPTAHARFPEQTTVRVSHLRALPISARVSRHQPKISSTLAPMTREPTALHLLLAVLATSLSAAVPASLPATQPLTGTGDLSAAMVAGLHRRLDTLTREVVTERSARWDQRVTSSGRAEHLLQTRATLARITGIIDPRVSPARLELLASPTFDGTAAESDRLRVLAVRWPVVGEVRAEGLFLQPKGPPRAVVVALPDADQTPEMISGLAPGVPRSGSTRADSRRPVASCWCPPCWIVRMRNRATPPSGVLPTSRTASGFTGRPSR